MSARNKAKHIMVYLLAAVLWAGAAPAKDALPEIERANQRMQEQRYDEAIRIYESVLESGFENGYLYYNLGNAYFRKGETGRAILNYLKAHDRIPREEKVEANLLFAIQRTEDKLDWHIPDLVTTLFFWVGDVTLREHIRVLLGLNVVFWFAAALHAVRGGPETRLARSIVLGALVLVLLSTTARAWHDRHRHAVVLAQTLPVYAERGEEKPVLFRLHEGAVMGIVEENDGWYYVRLADESTGWVRSPNGQVGT